ncbi:hypothetical protein M0R04_05880 [Candidatus Dojkabacteria bacterium]|jgi:hypothetical protein|nr:hypothetical protein [Candidatus Dojkabacteria bacterium]
MIIGIHGKARSGKDSLSDILEKSYGFKKVSFAGKLKGYGNTYFGLDDEVMYSTKTKQSRMILQGIGSMCRNEVVNVYHTLVNDHDLINKHGQSSTQQEYPEWVRELAVKYFDVTEKDLQGRKKVTKDILTGIFNMFLAHYKELYDVCLGVSQDVWVNILFDKLYKDSVYIINDVRYKNEYNRIKDSGGYVIKVVRDDLPEPEYGADHQSENDLDDVEDWDYIIRNEKKTDWQNRMSQAAGNLVRKISHDGNITEEQREKFLVNIDKYE